MDRWRYVGEGRLGVEFVFGYEFVDGRHRSEEIHVASRAYEMLVFRLTEEERLRSHGR